jgi:hypothetical protein
VAERNSRGGWDITDEEAAEIIRISMISDSTGVVRSEPKIFAGYRPQPPAEYAEKGITNSGDSPDYEGVIFSDGTVVIRWRTKYRSTAIFASWDEFLQVHGHPEYGTRIVFQGEEDW